MPSRIATAAPELNADGTPYSVEYGDVYHSVDSGPGQARHVFVKGNDLPARWANASVYTIVETGFGLGLNFLATWAAWRADRLRPARLHFLSIEKHPVTREALTALHARYPEFATLAGRLQDAWPPLLPGLHRLEFESGSVTLTLALADAVDAARRVRVAADGFYLDGFAPDRNPEMWSRRLLKALARLARPGATLATYTASRAVREALTEAGFACELRPGFGRKRHMLAARFSPRWIPRRLPPPAPSWPERRALIVGAGLAGAAVAERLAARGWQIDLIERHSAPAMEASGLPAGAFHPLVARDDSVLARLTRSGFLYALDRWQALQATGHRFEWQRCGVLQLARDEAEELRMKRAVSDLGLPPEYAEYLPHAAAARRATCTMAAGGLWFPAGGWLRPASLIEAQLTAAGARAGRLRLHTGREVRNLTYGTECWRALADNGVEIASAPVCVLANAHDAPRLAAFGVPAFTRVRGQITRLPVGCCSSLSAVLAGAGSLVPVPEGAITGASYELDSTDAAPRATSHAGNLARLKRMVPGLPRLESSTLTGSVAFRSVSVDRLPLIGAVPDLPAARAARVKLFGAQPRDIPRLPGLYAACAYASRGLTWSALGGEMIASLIEGEPLPLEGDLADAIDPARFAMQLARRGRL